MWPQRRTLLILWLHDLSSGATIRPNFQPWMWQTNVTKQQQRTCWTLYIWGADFEDCDWELPQFIQSNTGQGATEPQEQRLTAVWDQQLWPWRKCKSVDLNLWTRRSLSLQLNDVTHWPNFKTQQTGVSLGIRVILRIIPAVIHQHLFELQALKSGTFWGFDMKLVITEEDPWEITGFSSGCVQCLC